MKRRLRLFVVVVILGSWRPLSAQDLATWEARSKDYPFGIELRLVARDVGDEDYLRVLATMIPTDLAAEWRRVASPDNFRTFVEEHGGAEKVAADATLQAAADVRKEIAERFLELQRSAYANRKVKPAFDDAAVEAACREANQPRDEESLHLDPPIRALMPAPGAERQWPQFRGPTGQGIAQSAEFPATWSDTEHIAWKTPIPGKGNSSPVIWDHRLFVTTASQEGEERSIICLDRTSGDILWQTNAPAPETSEKLYWKNSFASSTPVVDGERVIVFFGNSGMLAVDFDGQQLWHVDLGTFPTMHGPGSAPVLYQDLVILIQDQHNADSVFVAVNKRTGEIAWKKPRERQPCWSTPLVVRVGDHDELLFNGSNQVIGYDPATGEQLWRVNGSSIESVPSLVLGGGWIFSASGRNGPYIAIRPGGQGDITMTHVVWATKQGGAHVPSPVYYEGRLFAVNDVGIAACLDAKTGRTVWQERLAGRFTTSPVLAGDVLIATNEDGTTYLLRAGDEFELLGENDLAETVYASPALLDGKLYFRSAEHVLCVAE